MTDPARTPLPVIRLKPGREKSLRRKHPWIFSGALGQVPTGLAPGDTVDIADHQGAFLARGAWSPHSQIRARVWTFDPDETIDESFFLRRIEAAITRRESFPPSPAGNALRLVNAESDGLPGVIVDRYADHLVIQLLTTGADRWRDAIVAALKQIVKPVAIHERSNVDVRQREGLSPQAGTLLGSEPPADLVIHEGEVRFHVDLREGHKTGFYLDQRSNRALVGQYAQGKRVLNAFAYSGGFGLHALKGGASELTNIELSVTALDLLNRNLQLNDVDPATVETLQTDAFKQLRTYRDTGRTFDLIILDPPKFADSRKQLQRAARGYKDINWLAFRILAPGGLLFTFSCSGLMEAPLFQKVVADAALDAGREARILQHLGQSSDHPTHLAFPEGAYLKGFLCQVD